MVEAKYIVTIGDKAVELTKEQGEQLLKELSTALGKATPCEWDKSMKDWLKEISKYQKTYPDTTPVTITYYKGDF